MISVIGDLVTVMRAHAVVCARLFRRAGRVARARAAANKEHLQLMAEIRMLQEQHQQLQALLAR